MSPSTAKLFIAAALSMLAGGAIGAYATRTIYGDSAEEIDPVPPRQKICPTCECPVCPPPPECATEQTAVPTSTAPRALLLPEDEEPDHGKPGLPSSAIKLAAISVKQEIAPCMAGESEIRGTLLLDLTVTATGGVGRVGDAALAEKSADAILTPALEACLLENSKRAHFEWTNEDGEAHMRLPIALKR